MKRWMPYVYILYLIFCMICFVYNINDRNSILQTDKYGLENNDTIELKEDSNIAVTFRLSHQSFEGVHVKFESEYGFLEEKIQACLYDSNHVLLAEDTVELKNELVRNKDSGSTIFFALPIDNAKDREVRLVLNLTGENIFVYPKLVVSKKSVMDSQLSIDGVSSAYHLVFTARYYEGDSRNIAYAVMNSILWVIAGSLIFLWFCSQDEKQSEALVKDSSLLLPVKNCWGQITKFSIKHKKLICFFGMICFLGIVFVYIYQYSVERAINQRTEQTIFEVTDESLIIDSSVTKLEQKFYCEYDSVSGVILSVFPQKISGDAGLECIVKDYSTGAELLNTAVPLSKLFKTDAAIKWRLSFDETVTNSADHILGIMITPYNFENSVINFQGGRLPQEGIAANEANLTVNGYEKDYAMALELDVQNSFFLKQMYVILCAALLCFCVVLFWVCFIHKASIPKVFVAFALIMGTIMCGVIALDTAPDEPSHIDTAYQISNELLGIQDSPKPNHIYKRADDVDSMVETRQKLGISNYERLYNQLFTKVNDETLVECSALNNLSNAGRIYYLPQALGMTVGRLLRFGMMPMMMLGRIFSLICYIIITWFAIRKLPFAKVSLLLLAILPISLQQAASFSYDAMINAVSFLFVSYCLYISYDRSPIRANEIAVILITGAMLATVKGGVYLPLSFLPLLALAARKELTKKQKTFIVLAVGVCLFAFVNGRLINTIIRLSTAQGTVTGGAKSTEIYTFGYLLKYPHRFLGMFVNTFYKQGDSYIRNLFGGNLAWRDVNISWFIVIGFLLLILLSCLSHKKESFVSGGQKIYIGLLVLGTFCLIELSMLLAWTPTTISYITGVQGRYFIPFFLLVLIILRNSFFTIKRNIDRKIIFGAGILSVITVLQVIQIVLER